jgi:hypothetical protein
MRFFLCRAEVRLARIQLAGYSIVVPVLVTEAVGVTHEGWVGLHHGLDYLLDEGDI